MPVAVIAWGDPDNRFLFPREWLMVIGQTTRWKRGQGSKERIGQLVLKGENACLRVAEDPLI